MEVYVAGIGVLGPGLVGWEKSSAILRGEAPYRAEPLELTAPEILSARERRRSSPTVRLALTVALEAVNHAAMPAEELATVFGSSNGSGLEIHKILEAVSTPEMLVSPTHFHNSVHNSSVGYWCIATGCHQPSTSIAGHDFTFPAVLLKTAAQVVSENRAVLLACFDSPLPEPLDSKRPLSAAFSVALVLTPAAHAKSLAKLSISWQSDAMSEDVLPPGPSGLHALWQGNPAARSLPLLEALALGKKARLGFEYPEDGRLAVELMPC